MHFFDPQPHSGHSHAEGVLAEAEPGRLTTRLKWALAATIGLVVAELVGGLSSHSIALITDGVHNLTDTPTLIISWLAARWALRPPTSEQTYGYRRVSGLGGVRTLPASRRRA
jgi:cobalt-zinc-cadmium efflux system protein